MRIPGSEKLEIIRIVEQSHLPARRTLEDARHPTIHVLSLVRSVSSRRSRGARRQAVEAQIASGTASPMMCASASSRWRWRSRS